VIYREIGKTGMKISVVGFGGMRFFNSDEETALATVRRCVDVGINFFETGNYGDGKSEIGIGKGLKGYVPRDKVILANKAAVSGLPTAGQVREAMERGLKREQTDYFDLYSLWGMNTQEMFEHAMKPDGPISVLLKAKEEGLIRAIGFTTHATPENIIKFADAYPWDCVTLKEHMLYSRQQEVIEHLASKGIGVVVMSPLAGGVVCAPGPDIKAELDRAGISAAEIGLRYLVANPHVTSAISGMIHPDEVVENVRAGETGDPLTETENQLVDLIRKKTTGLGEKFCTSCGYCMPCPEEVNIPGIFRLWNIMRGYGSSRYSKMEYGKLCREIHWADFPGKSAEHCVECGQCEDKCPEKLPIIADLKQAHADLTRKG